MAKLSSWTRWGPQRRRKPPASKPPMTALPPAAAQTAPGRVPAIHLRYGTTTAPPAACGKWAAAAWITTEPAEVTCRSCQRTVLYRKLAAP
jgi:hypothetical protein